MSKDLVIGGVEFRTRKAAEDYARDILYRYALGEIVTGADHEFVRDAFSRHPERLAKSGSGLDHFEVRSAQYGTRCFWAVDTVGSAQKFSMGSCLR